MELKHPTDENVLGSSSSPTIPLWNEEDLKSAPDQSPFSTIGNIMAAIIFAAGMSGFFYLILSTPPLSKVDDPNLALSLTVSRALDLEAALETVSPWEKWAFDLLTGGESSLDQSIIWFEELAGESDDSLTHMNLAILRGEAGQLDGMKEQTRNWVQREDPYPLFHRILRAAYGGQPMMSEEGWKLQAEVVDVLPTGWFYDQVALRIARQASQDVFIEATEQATAARVGSHVMYARQLIFTECAILLLALLAMVVMWNHRTHLSTVLKIGAYPLPPPWTGRMGALVFLRGGAGGIVMFMALLIVGWSFPFLQFISLPLIYLPLLALTSWYLLHPFGRGLIDGFGLWPVPGGWKGLVLVTPFLVAGLLIIELMLGYGSEFLDISIHWTEWFDPDLAWGDWTQVGITLIEYVLFAPLLEEIAFRGVLFGLFRRQFRFAPAAGFSGLIFAAAHGYGVLGFLSVFLSGCLWAWGYEKTGSLLPGMLAHAANNLIVCASVLLLVR